MNKYKITIEEIISEEFEVEATTADEALEIARLKYKCGEFVLSPGEVTSRQLAITFPINDDIEWNEF